MAEAYIFDLDGTLLDSMSMWEEIDEKFLSKRGFEVPDDYCGAIAAMGFAECAQYTKERFGLSESCDEIMSEWNAMACDEYKSNIMLKPHARELLKKLKAQGARLGVASTNHRHIFLPTLERTKILEFFESDAIISIDDVTTGKSSPEIYLKCAQRLGATPKECVVLEDTVQGIRTALLAGFRVIGVLDEHWADFHEEISKLCEKAVSDLSELL